mmetsp:Transcript_12020/g.18467  ORF Transcript_12020/g.18467 Transcript_12020/m.18467 type:complete len:136 (-) Transcript_12020:193-600(-)
MFYQKHEWSKQHITLAQCNKEIFCTKHQSSSDKQIRHMSCWFRRVLTLCQAQFKCHMKTWMITPPGEPRSSMRLQYAEHAGVILSVLRVLQKAQQNFTGARTAAAQEQTGKATVHFASGREAKDAASYHFIIILL